MLIFFFFFKFAKGLDRTVLTGSCSPTPVLGVHVINKKSGSLNLKNRFSFRFPIFTVRPLSPGPVLFLVSFVLPLSFYFLFFFCFSVWSLESLNCWVYIFRLTIFFFFFKIYMWAGRLGYWFTILERAQATK